jgi:hypothetical protein
VFVRKSPVITNTSHCKFIENKMNTAAIVSLLLCERRVNRDEKLLKMSTILSRAQTNRSGSFHDELGKQIFFLADLNSSKMKEMAVVAEHSATFDYCAITGVPLLCAQRPVSSYSTDVGRKVEVRKLQR